MQILIAKAAGFQPGVFWRKHPEPIHIIETNIGAQPHGLTPIAPWPIIIFQI